MKRMKGKREKRGIEREAERKIMGSRRRGETLITIRALIAGLSFSRTVAVNFRSKGRTFMGVYEAPSGEIFEGAGTNARRQVVYVHT